MIIKVRYNNSLNKNEKEQASKFGLLLKSRQIGRDLSFS